MSNTESAGTQWYEIAQTLGFTDEREMWEQLYVKERRSITELSKALGYGTATIARRIGINNVDKRTRGGANTPARTAMMMAHLDQRWLRMTHPREVATALGVSIHSVYRILKEERPQ